MTAVLCKKRGREYTIGLVIKNHSSYKNIDNINDKKTNNRLQNTTETKNRTSTFYNLIRIHLKWTVGSPSLKMASKDLEYPFRKLAEQIIWIYIQLLKFVPANRPSLNDRLLLDENPEIVCGDLFSRTNCKIYRTIVIHSQFDPVNKLNKSHVFNSVLKLFRYFLASIIIFVNNRSMSTVFDFVKTGISYQVIHCKCTWCIDWQKAEYLNILHVGICFFLLMMNYFILAI